MKRTLFAILFLTIFVSGCTVYQINSKETSDEYYTPKTNIDDVDYVQTPDKAFTKIAEVTVTTERNQALDDILPKLKQEAGMLGADAITNVQSDATDFWKKLPQQKIIGKAYIRTTYTADAITWNK